MAEKNKSYQNGFLLEEGTGHRGQGWQLFSEYKCNLVLYLIWEPLHVLENYEAKLKRKQGNLPPQTWKQTKINEYARILSW